ncbi:hypothetical protein ['Chrysanthemum coronarium' phytoplasma]|nr:hypothetical protein ['Chrysanthemum coronarium' phytoplasma]GAK74274.1 ATP-dependent Zn protease ['Chrysanthemum coronarium' phytoplasma]
MNSDSLSGLLDVLTPPEFNFENFKPYSCIFGLEEPIQKLKEIGDLFDLITKHKYNLGKKGKPTHTLEEIEKIFAKARKNSSSIVFADEAEETIKARDSKDFLEPGDAKKPL